MNEDDKKTETEVTPEGAVEIQEEDLDQASGGAIYMQVPAEQQDFHLDAQLTPELKDPSLKYAGPGPHVSSGEKI